MAKKEKGTRQPELQEILNNLDAYRLQLFNDSTTSATKFKHMQSAIHSAKQIVRDCYGAKREKGALAWVK